MKIAFQECKPHKAEDRRSSQSLNSFEPAARAACIEGLAQHVLDLFSPSKPEA
jgi:hypothetical protein